MAGETTLIVTTRSGVRPLGVRGEPLHNSAPQLRRVVRRRLGDGAADLLAEPQLHEDGKAIDWYAGWPGPVQPLSALDPERKDAVLAEVGRTLADIRRLGDALATAGPREDTGLVGLSLQLAARAPNDSFVFMVGDRPVIVCWGYEKEAANALLPAALPQPPLPSPAAHRPVLAAPAAERALPALRPASTVIPWARTLLAALPLLLLLLGAAWLLRGLLPADPALALATREGPDAPAAAEPPPDPKPALKAAFSSEESRGRVLKTELALIEAELRKRIADCKPPEAPKPPPQVALAPPPQPPKATPAPAPAPARAATAAGPAQRRSPAPAVGAQQRLFLHGGLLAYRSVPPRDDPAAARHFVLLLRRQRQRPARMAEGPHRLPDEGLLALRGCGPEVARRRHDLQRRLALVRRPARLPSRGRRRGTMQRHVARRIRPGLVDG